MTYEHYDQYCKQLQDTGKYRQLPDISLPTSNYKKIDFSSNDYLALSQSPILLEAALLAGQQYGVGATGSRILSGNTKLCEQFEARIAKDKGTEAALLFNSGFQANVSVLSSLLALSVLKSRALVFFDKLNHASLYQAVFLSGAELVRYHHNDIDHLSKRLEAFKNDNRPKFIVTETVFGMDGDKAPLEKLVNIAEQQDAFLYLDEAHATGVMGIRGYGLSTQVNLHKIKHCIMGTFSKALGCSGAYIACSELLKNYLMNKAGGFIYSTAASPLVMGAAFEAWKQVGTLEKQRNQLMDLANYLRSRLQTLGFNTGLSETHIIPIILGQEAPVMRLKQLLAMEGIFVSAIRPPTVPPNTARLRIALNVSNTPQEVDYFVDRLQKISHVLR